MNILEWVRSKNICLILISEATLLIFTDLHLTKPYDNNDNIYGEAHSYINCIYNFMRRLTTHENWI